MKGKNALIIVFLTLFFLPSFVQALPFYYVYDSLVEDKRYSTTTCLITEGVYFLVIDNTGIITENYDRNGSYFYYFIDALTANTSIDQGGTTVHADENIVIEFQFEHPDLIISEIRFEIYSQNPISAFITHSEGLTEYVSAVERIGLYSPLKVLLITLSSIGGVLILVGVVILFIKFTLPKIQINRARRRRKLQPLICPKCRTQNEPGVTVCFSCGEKFKRTGDRFKTIG